MSRIIDRQRFKRIYPFYKPRQQDSVLDGEGTTSQTSPNATYVVISSDAELPNERVITPGSGINGSDGGGGGNYTLSVDPTIVAFLSGCTFTGAVRFDSGLSGSLTTLSNGSSYLVAGSNVTIVSGSNGQVRISGATSVLNGFNYGNNLDVPVWACRSSTSNTTYIRAGVVELDPSALTGGTRQVKMRIIGEVTAGTLEARLYNLTTAAVVPNSSINTGATTPTLVTTPDLLGDLSAGSALYEIQFRLTNGGVADIASLGYAGLRVTWS